MYGRRIKIKSKKDIQASLFFKKEILSVIIINIKIPTNKKAVEKYICNPKLAEIANRYK